MTVSQCKNPLITAMTIWDFSLQSNHYPELASLILSIILWDVIYWSWFDGTSIYGEKKS